MFKTPLKYLLGLFFILAGLNHFINPDFYLNIMPAYLPWHLPLVYLSGLIEMVFGVLLLFPAFTVIAAWGLIALLFAVFPANVHMAMNPEFYNYPEIALWLRLPLQGVLILWAFWYTRSPQRRFKRIR